MSKSLAAAALTVAALALSAQPHAAVRTFPLTIDSIMRGPDLVGYPPDNLRWSGDSQRLYFEWRQPKDDIAATWVVSRSGGTPIRLSEEERRSAPLPAGQWDKSRRRQVGVDSGDIVVIDTVAKKRIDITRTTASETAPRWARNETAVTFVRDNNLFLVPLDGSGGLVQVTDVTQKRSDSRVTDSQRALRREETQILDWVEQERERRKRREARDAERALPRFELAERESVTDAALSGDSGYAYLMVTDRAQPRTAVVPRFVSESAYTEDIQARTKVGDAQDRRRLAILDLHTGEAVWAGLEGIAEPQRIPKPKAGDTSDEAPEPAANAPKLERDARWLTLILSADGAQAVASIRSNDNTDRWLARVDPATGRTIVLDHVHDDAWVRDIGPSGNIGGGLGWLPDNRRIWFLAEHTGWMQLYTVDASAAAPARTPVTEGAFEIDSVEVSPDGTQFYLQSSEAHPGERQIYRVPVDGGRRERLTTTVGGHQAAVSPDGEMLGLISSASNRPPEVFVMASRPGATATQVTTSTSDDWRGFNWVEPQLVQYKARDGAQVYARLFTPEMVGARRHASRPAVVFVHGAGYLQNAHRYWSSYYREYMFHHLLASQGYVVLDPDYRASAGYGRDWRTAIYGWMGGHDLNDVVDGAAYLAAAQSVNPRRIGVYGGSYGGFITLMAMFTSPDTFAAGAALRPVTDWAHYNHQYTSNILDEPQSSAETYRKSSPIYFAEGLTGALLICHGMVDTNVHFQDSVRLAQRLIELRKENWELAVYPVEDHGFIEAASWADEYKRILRLFDANLKR
jgi:dipeptidyl aminopeptidase/acylaminoacyl peptidase